MDFTRQGAPVPSSSSPQHSNKKSKKGFNKLMGISAIVLLFSSTILVVALLLFIAFTGNGRGESRLVDTSKLQAVFLNGGQVYFGKITGLSDKNMVLEDIYYLRVNQQVQPDAKRDANDISLVKLGCELHGPEDRMVIKQDQIIFWENLKEDGDVSQAVKTFKSQNPNGLSCDKQQDAKDNN
jgi:hypothetical protein